MWRSWPLWFLYIKMPMPSGLGRSSLYNPSVLQGLFCEWPVWQGKSRKREDLMNTQSKQSSAKELLIFPWITLDYVIWAVYWNTDYWSLTILILHVLSQKGERCLCNPGFLGHSCQLGLHDDNGVGQWWRVSEGNPYTPPRTGSAGVYLSSAGAMYLFGGERDALFISFDVVFINGKWL